jgi:hypothetical protein
MYKEWVKTVVRGTQKNGVISQEFTEGEITNN